MIIRVRDLSYQLICLGILLLPTLLRKTMLDSETLGLINIVTWLGVLMMCFYSRKDAARNKIQKSNSSVIGNMFVILLVLLFWIFIAVFSNVEIINVIKYSYAIVLPCFLIFIKISRDDVKYFINVFSKTLTIACSFVVFCGLADMILGTRIGDFFVNYYNSESLVEMMSGNRLVSYFGHSLLTTEFMLICFSFNTIRDFYFKKKPSFLYTVYYCLICIIGIALTASKTGLVLFALEFVLLYQSPKRIKYIILAAIVMFFAYKLGFFDVLIDRFMTGYETGDLTTGRNASLFKLYRFGLLKFYLFTAQMGRGAWNNSLIAALEYPILRWAYLYGIWFAVYVSAIVFVYPVIVLLKSKNIRLLIVAIILMLDVNSYSGLSVLGDYMLIYCICIFLLLNVSYYLEGEKNEALHNLPESVHPRRGSKSGYYNYKRTGKGC